MLQKTCQTDLKLQCRFLLPRRWDSRFIRLFSIEMCVLISLRLRLFLPLLAHPQLQPGVAGEKPREIKIIIITLHWRNLFFIFHAFTNVEKLFEPDSFYSPVQVLQIHVVSYTIHQNQSKVSGQKQNKRDYFLKLFVQ